jgi:dCTP deaminase
MILSVGSLLALLPTLIPNADERDRTLVNPASVDVRIGRTLWLETKPSQQKLDQWYMANTTNGVADWSSRPNGVFKKIDLPFEHQKHFILRPREFALVDLYESVSVPNGYAVELKLKSSRAREGYNHSLAFWVDPGWTGYLTMEIHNITQWQHLPLWCGLRFAQLIVHQLDKPAIQPYCGRYQGAKQAELSKHD